MQGCTWIVSQIGNREYYSVPRAFHQRGRLRLFLTDVWYRWGFKNLPGPLWPLVGRHHPDLPPEKVVGFNSGTFYRRGLDLLRPRKPGRETYEQYIEIGQWFARKVNRRLAGERLDPERDLYFTFCTGALETLQMLRNRGIFTVVDQLDPAQMDEEMIRQEMVKWPGWQDMSELFPQAYYDRLAQEWHEASVVLVNSNWSKSSLIRQDVPESKIIVVPLAYEPPHEALELQRRGKARRPPSEPLVVLFLGQVILRKGVPYLIEAGRLLKDANVQILIAGRVGLSAQAVASAPANVHFLGRVDHEKAQHLWVESDAFVLPTVSDGFALTQLEAMAHGMPVITTRNCGDVVSDGVDGLIVPTCDSGALAAAIAKLVEDRSLLADMSRAAMRTSRLFSLEYYADRVEAEVAARFPAGAARASA